MSSTKPKLIPIVDPQDKSGKKNELPLDIKMKGINTMRAKGDKDKEKVAPLPNQVPDSKFVGLTPLYMKDRSINSHKLSELILDSIESIDSYKGFAVGKGANRVNCGHTIQKVPTGGYIRIEGGESVLYEKPPVEKKPKMIFKFDRKLQLAFKVGNNVGKDWVVIVTANGCIFCDTGSYASFPMPVFIVKQNGEYYMVDKGNCILLLGTGHHLVLYTERFPIVYIRNHTVTRQKSIPLLGAIDVSPVKSSVQTLKTNSLESNEPLEQMAKENQSIVKKMVTDAPKAKETPSVIVVAPVNRGSSWNKYLAYSLLLILVLLSVSLLFRFRSKLLQKWRKKR